MNRAPPVGDGSQVIVPLCDCDCSSDDREPEAGALTRALGEADERLEDPVALISGDSGPVVGHRDSWTVQGVRGFDDDGVGDRDRVVEQVSDCAKKRAYRHGEIRRLHAFARRAELA